MGYASALKQFRLKVKKVFLTLARHGDKSSIEKTKGAWGFSMGLQGGFSRGLDAFNGKNTKFRVKIANCSKHIQHLYRCQHFSAIRR